MSDGRTREGTQLMFVVSDLWDRGGRPYRKELFDPKTDQEVDLRRKIKEMVSAAGVLDGETVSIRVERVGTRPFGERRKVFTADWPGIRRESEEEVGVLVSALRRTDRVLAGLEDRRSGEPVVRAEAVRVPVRWHQVTSAEEAGPDWTSRVVRLWKEDEVLRHDPDAEHLSGALRRVASLDLQDLGPPLDRYDGGDHGYDLYTAGWVREWCFDGDGLCRLVEPAPVRPVLDEARFHPYGVDGQTPYVPAEVPTSHAPPPDRPDAEHEPEPTDELFGIGAEAGGYGVGISSFLDSFGRMSPEVQAAVVDLAENRPLQHGQLNELVEEDRADGIPAQAIEAWASPLGEIEGEVSPEAPPKEEVQKDDLVTYRGEIFAEHRGRNVWVRAVNISSPEVGLEFAEGSPLAWVPSDSVEKVTDPEKIVRATVEEWGGIDVGVVHDDEPDGRSFSIEFRQAGELRRIASGPTPSIAWTNALSVVQAEVYVPLCDVVVADDWGVGDEVDQFSRTRRRT